MLQTKRRKCEKQNAETKSLNTSHTKITSFLPQVSNKKPEHVDGQQPTVVGPLVAKITPNSSCRLPHPSDALRHGSIAVKKTCTQPAVLVYNWTPLMPSNKAWAQLKQKRKPVLHQLAVLVYIWTTLMASNKAWAPLKQQRKPVHHQLNNQTPLMAFNMPWNQMRHPLHHWRFLRFLEIITKLAMTLIFYHRRCWQLLNIRGFNKVNIGECGLLSS